MSGSFRLIFQRIKQLFLQPNIYPPLEVKTQQSDPVIHPNPPTPTQPISTQEQPKKGPSIAEMAEQHQIKSEGN